MKPMHLFLASFVMLSLMGVSFNWTQPDRPIIVEVLGVLGTFAWLPLLIAAGIWAYRDSKSDRE